jgi:diaminopimelate decarboxylase
VRHSPWPSNAVFDEQGLTVAGLTAAELAERYGTPLVVVDEQDFLARCRSFREAFPRVLFAVKAFPIRPLIRLAHGAGLGFLAATDGELETCLRAGVPASSIALHGNNKSDRELQLAVENQVFLVIADNSEELERLDRFARDTGRRQPVLVRVTPGVEGHTHAYVDTGGAHSKFGTPIAEGLALQAIKQASALTGLEFRGIHAHVGSQLLTAEPFLAEIEVLLDLIAEIRDSLGLEVQVLDVGGGFGGVYTDEVVPDPGDIGRTVLDAISTGVARRKLAPPEVVVEPGRALTANAALTVYRVGSIKRTPGGPTFAAVDGGMSDNIRPALYGSRYTVAVASRPSTSSDPMETFRVVGRHCESGDVLGDVELPVDLAVDDLIAFASTGAYTYAMASNYNRVGRPAVVAVAAGASDLWMRREDTADLDRLDVSSAGEPDASVPDGIVIRAARPGDVASFLQHLQSVADERRFIRTEQVAGSRRLWKQRFRSSRTDRSLSLVAVDGAKVVGSLGIQREAGRASEHVASLGMSVTKEWRGRGIGTALMAEAMHWARGVGVEKVSLTVYPSNSRAIALYRRFGFVDEGRLSGQSKKSYGYEDEVIMSRWLVEGVR